MNSKANTFSSRKRKISLHFGGFSGVKPTVTQSHVANTITTEEGERFDQDCDLSKGQSDEDAMNDAGEVADFKRDGRNQFEDSSSLNPVTGKATVISLLDFSSIHTKNFYFSWISFCVAFFCWFAFPSIITSVKNDLQLSSSQVANSNVLGLTSTFFVRLVSGSLCDRYGPRITMAVILLFGAIPTACSVFIKDATGLYFVRFFIGILGGSFVPCQVWTTAFYDKSVVGTANALAGGWGNAGGGIAFFVLPAIVSALEANHGYSESNAWRVSILVVPFIMLVVCAGVILMYGDDCPQGKWKDRVVAVDANLSIVGSESNATLDTTSSDNLPFSSIPSTPPPTTPSASSTPVKGKVTSPIPLLKDSLSEILAILTCPQTLVLFVSYLCCFGGEIALESYLVPWYTQVLESENKRWSQQQLGNFGSIFGLANVVTRPLGGYVSDLLYESNMSATTRSTSLRGKKAFLVILLGLQGVAYFLLSFIPNLSIKSVLVLSTLLAIASEVGNGAVYSLVPHIHPGRNGYVSGFVGAGGNVGGVIFSLLYRFMSFTSAFWVIGLFLWAGFVVAWVVPVDDGLYTQNIMQEQCIGAADSVSSGDMDKELSRSNTGPVLSVVEV